MTNVVTVTVVCETRDAYGELINTYDVGEVDVTHYATSSEVVRHLSSVLRDVADELDGVKRQ